MRLLHTADWHLNDKLGKFDRTADLRKNVERIAVLCLEHQVDVLLIAGDLFYEEATLDQMHSSLMHLRDTFREFFERGGTILAITGNHDRDSRLNLLRSGLFLATPKRPTGNLLSPGRFYLQNEVQAATLDSNGHKVQFVTMPYPYASRYGLSANQYSTREEEHRLVRAKVIDRLRYYSDKLDTSLQTVLLAHLNVRGSETNTLYKMSEADDHQFEFAELNPNWAYVALGHIHKPQCLNGAQNVRYPGSLDRLDFGEIDNQPQVILVDLVPGEPVRTQVIELPGTPLLRVSITDPEIEIPLLTKTYPNLAESIVTVRVAQHFQSETLRRLRAEIPRLYAVEWLRAAERPTTSSPFLTTRQDLPTVVRAYLERELADDADKAKLLALTEEYLSAFQPLEDV